MDKKDKLNILIATHDDIDYVAAAFQVQGVYPGLYFSWIAKVVHRYLGIVFIFEEDVTAKKVAFNPYAYTVLGEKKTANILFLKKYKYMKIFFFR